MSDPRMALREPMMRARTMAVDFWVISSSVSCSSVVAGRGATTPELMTKAKPIENRDTRIRTNSAVDGACLVPKLSFDNKRLSAAPWAILWPQDTGLRQKGTLRGHPVSSSQIGYEPHDFKHRPAVRVGNRTDYL